MRSKPVAELGREANTRADYCAGRLRLLLASSSLAALLIGGGAPAVVAAPNCKIIQSGGTIPSVTNSSTTGNCILIENSAQIIGSVTNTSGSVLTTNGAGAPSSTGITINNSTIGGGVRNAGTITAQSQGIVIDNAVIVSGGISSSGTIMAPENDIALSDLPTFTGNISNAGSLSSNFNNGVAINGGVTLFDGSIVNSGRISAYGDGLNVGGISTFTGIVSNSGTITAHFDGIVVVSIAQFGAGSVGGGITNSGIISAGNIGIEVSAVAQFGTSSAGGISNSGTISAGNVGIAIFGYLNFAGGISNSGAISAGSGIFVIDVKTFAGGISNSGTISAARVGIGVGDITGFSGGISNSGTISTGDIGISIGGIADFAGGISNSGTISSKNNDGIVVSGVAQFGSTGGAISNSGTISANFTGVVVGNVTTFADGITNIGTISGVTGIVVENSSPVSVFDSGVIVGTGGTAVDLSGNAAGNTFTLGPGYGITGKVLGQGSDTFQLGGTGSDSFDLSLIGPTRQYQGFTTFNVVSGTWTVSNTFGLSQAWNVNGGTLAGVATLNAINVNNGGTLEPGVIGSPGTFMTVNGNLTFQSGATYLINLNPTTASRANVSGAATLNGAAVQGALAAGSYTGKTTYIILDPSSINGTFSGFTAINAPGFGGSLTYNGNTDVLLNLTAQIGAGGGLNQNQQTVATAFNNFFNNGGTLPADLFSLFTLTGPSLNATLTQIDGEVATGAQTSAFRQMTEFLNLLLDPGSMGGSGAGTPLGFASEQASLPPDIALAYASLLKASSPASFARRWTTWGAAYGGSSTADGNAAIGSNNLTSSEYGFAGGMEYHVDPATLYGFALAGGGLNWGLANALGTGRGDSFQGGVYGKHYFGAAYVSGAVGFGNDWFTTNRTALGEDLTASFQGQSYALRFEGGYRYGLQTNGGAAGVTPYTALQTQWFHTPAYSENGGMLALAYNSQTANDTRTELGIRFDDLTTLNIAPLILRAKLAWAHDFVGDPSLGAAFQTLPGSTFTVNGAPIPRDTVLTSASAQWLFTPNWSLTAKFDGDFASGYALYAGTGTLRYMW